MCAEEIQGPAIRCRFCGASQIAPPAHVMPTPGARNRVGTPIGPILGLVGALLFLVGSMVPYEHGLGHGWAIFGFRNGQVWWGIEPVLAAGAVAAASLLLLIRARQRWFGGILVGVGVQTLALYLGYVGASATAGSGTHLGAGGLIGLLGAGLVLGGGLVHVLAPEPATAPAEYGNNDTGVLVGAGRR